MVEIEQRYGPLAAPARDLLTIARIKTLAAELGIATVSLARHRLNLSPVTLSDAERGVLAGAGAVYVARTRSVHFVEMAGEAPGATALRALGAILSAVQSPSGGPNVS